MGALSEKEIGDLRQMLTAYLDGRLNEEGINELFDHIRENISSGDRVLLEESLRRFQFHQATAPRVNAAQSERMLKRLLKEIEPRSPYIFWSGWRSYAAILGGVLIAGALAYLLLAGGSQDSPALLSKETHASTKFKNDIPPGDNKAILTLDDGSLLVLDTVSNGELLRTGNTKIIKLNNGRLDYRVEGVDGRAKQYDPASDWKGVGEKISFNTITTPRGGQYQVTLPDGTRVWLNSASQLRFPTRFTGDKRVVELKGEAYMEVASDADQPFEVAVNDISVRVLGTDFNIMAYPEEGDVVTTLVNGAVQVRGANSTALLKPGEHAVIGSGGIKVRKANVEEEIAWKNGFIQYSRASIQQIMRQVSRWYNVDVVYEGDMSNKDFACAVSRRAHVSELLKILELTGAVHFDIEGNRIIVRP